jgi:hypothetical protein
MFMCAGWTDISRDLTKVRLFSKCSEVARRAKRRRPARVCPFLISLRFNRGARVLFQRVSIDPAVAGAFIGFAKIPKSIFRAKFELHGAALLERGQTVRSAMIWHHESAPD